MNKDEGATRCERHVIRPTNPHYELLRSFCHEAKNLYNHANYLIRQELFVNKQWLRYGRLDKILQKDVEYPDYRAVPTASSAQQLLRTLDKTWRGFFASCRDFKEHPDKYTGRPRPPRYKAKDGFFELTMTYRDCRVKEGVLLFPKRFAGFTLRLVNDVDKVQMVKVIPQPTCLVIVVTYRVAAPQLKPDNGRYLGIDLGVDNFATVVNNQGVKPLVVNGRGLKSMNRYFNIRLAWLQRQAKRINKKFMTKRIARLHQKRAFRIDDFMHKASRLVVNLAMELDVSKIVVGYNEGWKQGTSLGRKVNQRFVQIPFQSFVNKLVYKAADAGVEVILHEESFTSGTSVLDNEPPTRGFYDRSRRVKRGLFRSSSGTLINADVNAAYQIIRKVFPNEFSEGVSGVALHPARRNVA